MLLKSEGGVCDIILGWKSTYEALWCPVEAFIWTCGLFGSIISFWGLGSRDYFPSKIASPTFLWCHVAKFCVRMRFTFCIWRSLSFLGGGVCGEWGLLVILFLTIKLIAVLYMIILYNFADIFLTLTLSIQKQLKIGARKNWRRLSWLLSEGLPTQPFPMKRQVWTNFSALFLTFELLCYAFRWSLLDISLYSLKKKIFLFILYSLYSFTLFTFYCRLLTFS